VSRRSVGKTTIGEPAEDVQRGHFELVLRLAQAAFAAEILPCLAAFAADWVDAIVIDGYSIGSHDGLQLITIIEAFPGCRVGDL